MRKYLVFLCVVALVFVGVSAVFAGGIDNKNNFSAEYVRTLNRAHATDAPDAAVYNPAGTIKLKDGFHVSLSNQYVIKHQTHTMETSDAPGRDLSPEWSESTPIPLLPSLHMVYKQDQFAGFFSFTIPSGGGTVNYNEGSYTPWSYFSGVKTQLDAGLAALGAPASTMRNGSFTSDLKVNSLTYGFTAGGAFEVVKDLVSIAAGGRLLMFRQTTELNDASAIYDLPAGAGGNSVFVNINKAKYSEWANGFGGTFGINITPTKELNVGIKYDTVVRMQQKYSIKEDEVDITSGTNNAVPQVIAAAGAIGPGLKQQIMAPSDNFKNRDLPPVFSIGASYKVMEDLLVAASYTAYITKDAMWSRSYRVSRHQSDQTMDQRWYNESMEAGLCVEYNVTKELKVSVGYLYNKMGTYKSWYKQIENPEGPTSNSFALGFAFDAGSGLVINFGVLKAFYPDFKTTHYNGSEISGPQSWTYKKDLTDIAIGVNYSI